MLAPRNYCIKRRFGLELFMDPMISLFVTFNKHLKMFLIRFSHFPKII